MKKKLVGIDPSRFISFTDSDVLDLKSRNRLRVELISPGGDRVSVEDMVEKIMDYISKSTVAQRDIAVLASIISVNDRNGFIDMMIGFVLARVLTARELTIMVKEMRMSPKDIENAIELAKKRMKEYTIEIMNEDDDTGNGESGEEKWDGKPSISF